MFIPHQAHIINDYLQTFWEFLQKGLFNLYSIQHLAGLFYVGGRGCPLYGEELRT